MAELIPAPFADLVTRLYREPAIQGTVFDLPRRNWHARDPSAPDLSVTFHDQPAGNPLGPAAGPHTQMAQNLLLSYVGGARILELKTVQVNDQLVIPRPCIDMTNVGYNVEWSQELAIDDSLREYVAGSMLIKMFRSHPEYASHATAGLAGDVIYDMSVGYDFAGIKGDKVRRFIHGMKDAARLVDKLRSEIPRAFASARDMDYTTNISDSITLSTFHGCPADEIERICEFLIAEHDVHVIVKMNPPTLGKERLEHLLHDVLGYHSIRVNPKAYDAVMPMDESIQLCDRLTRFSRRHSRHVGFKFSNTLEVTNHREFFTSDNEIMYLSGQPLHVITMALTDEFRRAVGAEVPISFSAGVDAKNFADAVACGFVPITVSTDWLRPGGYGRISSYLARLTAAMENVAAKSWTEFIFKRFAASRTSKIDTNENDVQQIGLENTSIVARQVREDPRYRAEQNIRIPKRIESTLNTFDCITCDKCIPVCPNGANFTYPTPVISLECRDLLIEPSGQHGYAEARTFEIKENMQIACYADFCNECGNCDTFCPEYGGPYIKKPSFFGSVESWERAAPRDGFIVGYDGDDPWIRGRILGREYRLAHRQGVYVFADGVVEVTLTRVEHRVHSVTNLSDGIGAHRVNMLVYHTLRHLLSGVLDMGRVNQINASLHAVNQP